MEIEPGNLALMCTLKEALVEVGDPRVFRDQSAVRVEEALADVKDSIEIGPRSRCSFVAVGSRWSCLARHHGGILL